MSDCYERDRAARKLRHRKRNSCVFSAAVITCFLIHFWTQKSVLPEGPKIQTTIADLTHPCLTYPHALVRCGVWSMEDVDTARECQWRRAEVPFWRSGPGQTAISCVAASGAGWRPGHRRSPKLSL